MNFLQPLISTPRRPTFHLNIFKHCNIVLSYRAKKVNVILIELSWLL